MKLQLLLIEGIEFLEALPKSADVETKIQSWKKHLDTLNAESSNPICGVGYYWNGTTCVLDVGKK